MSSSRPSPSRRTESGKKAARTIARDCLGVRARLLGRVVTSLYENAMAEHGVKLSQVNVLVAVAHGDGLRPADVARILGLEPSSLSRNVDRLKKAGWVTAERAPEGRGQVLRVTAAGGELLARILPDWRKAQRRAARLLGEDGVDALRAFAVSHGPEWAAL